MSELIEDIKKDKPENVFGVSCKKRYKKSSKLINGYSQFESVPRALGFPHCSDIQLKVPSHLITALDVETVVLWLFEQGYDIVKLKKKP